MSDSKEEHPPLVMAKPPLGVIERWRWQEMRATALAEAIVRYVNAGLTPGSAPLVLKWAEELRDLIRDMDRRPSLRPPAPFRCSRCGKECEDERDGACTGEPDGPRRGPYRCYESINGKRCTGLILPVSELNGG